MSFEPFVVDSIHSMMLQAYATVARELTCFKKKNTCKTLGFMKIMVCKFPLKHIYPVTGLAQRSLKNSFCGLGCCQAYWGLPGGFFLIWYSVLFTIESLSLLYLLFIS